MREAIKFKQKHPIPMYVVYTVHVHNVIKLKHFSTYFLFEHSADFSTKMLGQSFENIDRKFYMAIFWPILMFLSANRI